MDLNEIACQYIKINEEIKLENEKLKDKKEQKSRLMKMILQKMLDTNTKIISVSNGSIVLQEKESKVPLNKKIIN